MLAVAILGLLINAIALPLAGKRVLFLYRVISSGQPAPDRIEGVTGRMGAALKRQVVEVFGQKKLLKWSIPGAAHFFVFWAFIILGTVYLEAYGSLFKLLFTAGDGKPDWAIPLVGEWAILGFAQDFIAMMAFFGIAAFAWIRFQQAPSKLGRKSRFSGSHLSGAWITLFMIFNVLWTMILFRGASSALDNLPYDNGAYLSIGTGKLIDGLAEGPLEVLEGIGLLLHIGVMLVFLIFVLNSKHLHIFVAPLNVLFARPGVALGGAKPLMNNGKPVTLDDLDDLDEDSTLGVGSIEDFSWKGILDFSTCTECGRCQDQCPAWNTEKPLSPKLMIMALRDHAMAKAPYTLADEKARETIGEGNETLTKEIERPLIGETGDEWFYMPEDGSGVIDPDVLWSCVTCGACVEQCPVDIEHVDHIIDMRRHQVLVESNFPAELNGLFKGMENKGNPWNLSATARMDWAKDLDFEVKVVGEQIESLDEVDWLFWVGCAGAYEDRAKKTTRAVAELLDMAGVTFGVLGNGETCTGDSARRAGNEFIFQGLAQQNIETFKEHQVKKVVSTCAHCFNTLKNEYSDLGIELEVVHHTQLLNRLVREGKLTPVTEGEGAHKRSITYHDPCYIGRHNGVYSPPRELLEILPGASYVEMERNSEKSFCCGAGGARMWMEENIGSRINENRTNEAVGTGADQIAVGCPFCRVMLSDGLTNAQANGTAREEVEVLDVAQMLLASVKGSVATKYKPGEAPADDAPVAKKKAVPDQDEATKAEPEPGDVTQTEETVTDTADVGPAAKASGGSSLFDDDGGEAEEKPAAKASGGSSLFDDDSTADEPPKKPAASGGSLFDDPEPAAEDSAPEAAADTDAGAEGAPDAEPATEKPAASGGSLFDLGDPEPESKAEAKSEPKADPDPQPEAETEQKPEPVESGTGGGSLFDIAAPEPTSSAPATSSTTEAQATAEPEADTEPEPEPETDPEPEAEPEAGVQPEPTPAETPAAAAPAAEIPEDGSLFDLEAPAAPEPTSSSPEPEAEAEPEPEPEAEADEPTESTEPDDALAAPTDEAESESESEATRSGSTLSAGAALSAAATQAAGEEPEDGDASETPTEDAEPEPAAESPDEEEAAEEAPVESVDASTDEDEEPAAEESPEPDAPAAKEKPTSSGATHEPQTDVDINESGSLFDL